MVDEEYLNELYFVDYCNNCKDLEVYDPKSLPCHHPWYCWHDNGLCQSMEYEIHSLIELKKRQGFLNPLDYYVLKLLRRLKRDLIVKKLREYRRMQRRKR